MSIHHTSCITSCCFIAERVAGEDEAEALATEVEGWIEQHLGPAYPWAGNFRELEQCVRNILIRGEYRIPEIVEEDPRRNLTASVASGELTAEELLRRYCTLVYSQTGNYQDAARRLELDRRTMKSKIDAELLATLRSTQPRD